MISKQKSFVITATIVLIFIGECIAALKVRDGSLFLLTPAMVFGFLLLATLVISASTMKDYPWLKKMLLWIGLLLSGGGFVGLAFHFEKLMITAMISNLIAWTFLLLNVSLGFFQNKKASF